MKTPLLSICIATLNRAAFIGATLDSIISQATDEVEIVIVDGASTDNTEEVVRQYQHWFPRLYYLRLEVKGGVDQDYCKAVELAQGEYCWLFSDDDLLKPGAIQAVLAETPNNYSLIIVNAEVRNADLSRLLDSKRLQISANRVYRPADSQRLFVETINYLSFIGCVVIKRNVWHAREKAKYLGTEFVHVGVIFQSPLPGNTFVIDEPLISIRYGLGQWTSRRFAIWMFKWPTLVWSFPDYPDTIKQCSCPREPWRSIKQLMIMRAKHAFSLREYRDWIEPCPSSMWWRFLAKTIALVPGCIVNFLGVIYYGRFYNKTRIPLEDMMTSPSYYVTCLKQLANRLGRRASREPGGSE